MNQVAAKILFESEVDALSNRVLSSRNWVLGVKTYPVLEVTFQRDDRKPLMLRMCFDGWNAMPPSVAMLTPEGARLPTPLSGGIFNSTNHNVTGAPFICMAGTREYHTYHGHLTDPWDGYRVKSGYDLGGIITRIWDGWARITCPA